ncbi:MAG: FAD-dependent oxidoreductase, partial [Clostridia bacterium]|nr:FAD-dependent oxidoreductase [Clostridia bacterium]
GPSALDIEDKDDVSTTAQGLNLVMEKGKLSVPDVSAKHAITEFSGIRAHCDRDDFIIGMSKVEGFYNVAGIESPGLTSAPAIGLHVAGEIADYIGAKKKSNYPVIRKGIPHFAQLSSEERAALIASDPRYGNIVCRCECVTEGEIVNSIMRPLGARDMDGVKRRTRAGMGRCQAGFCSPSVLKIIATTLGVPISTITKCGRRSYTVSGKIK